MSPRGAYNCPLLAQLGGSPRPGARVPFPEKGRTGERGSHRHRGPGACAGGTLRARPCPWSSEDQQPQSPTPRGQLALAGSGSGATGPCGQHEERTGHLPQSLPPPPPVVPPTWERPGLYLVLGSLPPSAPTTANGSQPDTHPRLTGVGVLIGPRIHSLMVGASRAHGEDDSEWPPVLLEHWVLHHLGRARSTCLRNTQGLRREAGSGAGEGGVSCLDPPRAQCPGHRPPTHDAGARPLPANCRPGGRAESCRAW